MPSIWLATFCALARRLADDRRLQGRAATACANLLEQSVHDAVLTTTPRTDATGLSLYVPAAPLPIERAQRQYDSLLLGERAPGWREALTALSAP